MVNAVKSRPNHYEILGLKPTASDDDIAAAFAAESRKIIQNPRVNEPDVREQARKIREAHQTLRDPFKRRAYDASLARAAEPGRRRMQAPSEAVATPFMAAPSRNTAREGAREKAGDPESQIQPKKRPRATAASKDQPVREVPSASVKRRDGTSRGERRRPKAQAEPQVAPFIAAAGAGATARAARETTEGRAARPESKHRPDGRWEPGLDAPVGPEDGLRGSDAEGSARDSDQRRSRRYRTAAGAGVLIAAVAVFALFLWPQVTGLDRPSSTPPARIAASADAPATAASPVSADPSELASPAQVASPIPEESGAGPVETFTIGDGELEIVPLPPLTGSSSAPPAGSASPGTVDVQPGQADATGDAAVATDAAPAPPVEADAQPTPDAGAQATGGEAAPTAVAPTAPTAVASQETPAKLVSGSLQDSDNAGGRFQGTVKVRFTVSPAGQATGCRTVSSSGNPALDSRTCELIEQRLKFSPALSSQGQPVTSQMQGTYTWGRKHRSITEALLQLVRKLRP